MPGIGLLNEKALHAALKEWYALPGDRFEVPVDGFIVDIVRDGLLLEIQTGNFSSIKSKLRSLLYSHPIRLIYPIAQEKWIVRSAKGDAGEITRRKSPRRGRVEDLFGEMVSIPELLLDRNFSLEVLMTREEEVRRYEGKRRRLMRGWAVEERQLLEVVDRKLFGQPTDWLHFLPDGLDSFTTRDLAEAIGIGTDLAQKMAYCLRNARVVEMTGKRGRANLYRVARV